MNSIPNQLRNQPINQLIILINKVTSFIIIFIFILCLINTKQFKVKE